ncbi:MAG TPA: hypothetical protein VN316_00545 [candidate division Zixibacteria bacterium]|nr:hypothetical protein [candidate division Zixibacteria bacterium]
MGLDDIYSGLAPRMAFGIIVLSSLLLSTALAQPFNDTQPYSKNPKLESVLSQLISANDPKEFTGVHDLYMQDGKVRAVVEITDEKALLPAFVVEETRYKNRVQVLVPVEKLVELANETNVTFIRAPSRPFADVQESQKEAQAVVQAPTPKSGFGAAILFILSIASVFIIRKKRSDRNVKKR